MARIRSVHPGQWTDEDFVSCSMAARLLAIAIRNFADDQGVFEWKPVTIKMTAFPADDVNVAQLLEELVAANVVARFDYRDKPHGAIRNFCKYQRPKTPIHTYHLPEELKSFVGAEESQEATLRKRKWEEAGGRCFYCAEEVTHYSKRANSLEVDHRIPLSRGGTDDDDNLVAACRRCNRAKHDMSEGEFRKSLAKTADNSAKGGIPSQRKEGGDSWKEEGGEEETITVAAAPMNGAVAPRPARYPPDFETFWEAYPLKVGKGAALAAWQRAKKLVSLDVLLRSLDRKWPAEKRFIPHPATFLNERRWEDEIRVAQPANIFEGMEP